MKLQLPKHLQNMLAHMQPALPAKKRPAFPEFTATTEAMLQAVDKTLPLKLHVSGFLLEPPVLTVPLVLPR
jgi:Golgi nucleoside diphosphatase